MAMFNNQRVSLYVRRYVRTLCVCVQSLDGAPKIWQLKGGRKAEGEPQAAVANSPSIIKP